MRIHRNALVSVRYLEGIERNAEGQYLVRLRGCPAPLQVSRRMASELRDRFRIYSARRVVERVEVQAVFADAARGEGGADGFDQRGRPGGVDVERRERWMIRQHGLVHPPQPAMRRAGSTDAASDSTAVNLKLRMRARPLQHQRLLVHDRPPAARPSRNECRAPSRARARAAASP